MSPVVILPRFTRELFTSNIFTESLCKGQIADSRRLWVSQKGRCFNPDLDFADVATDLRFPSLQTNMNTSDTLHLSVSAKRARCPVQPLGNLGSHQPEKEGGTEIRLNKLTALISRSVKSKLCPSPDRFRSSLLILGLT